MKDASLCYCEREYVGQRDHQYLNLNPDIEALSQRRVKLRFIECACGAGTGAEAP